MPNSLQALIDDPQVPVYGGSHGFETRAGVWSPPAVIDDATRAAARHALGERSRLLEVKASRRQATEWTLSLMMLTSGRTLSTDDAKGKSAAFAEMLIDYPAALFTRESLKRASAEFKFFPSYAELAERLDMDLRRLERERKRLAVLVDPPKPKAEARVESIVRSAVRRMGDERPREAKPREPILTHPLTAEQLAEWEKAVS